MLIILYNFDYIDSIVFSWTRENTKLLLQSYSDRKNQFQDPKIKKKILWSQIVKEFEIKGCYVLEDILDRKMRNLKQTYKNIKDNNKKASAGRGRISWEWFDIMEKTFREDKTININKGATLSSMVSLESQNDNVEQCVPLPLPAVSYTEKIQATTIVSTYSDTEVRDSVRADESWCVRALGNYFSFNIVGKTNNSDCFRNTSLYSPINFYVSNWLKNGEKFKLDSYMFNEDTRYGQFINNHVINKHKSFDYCSQTISSIPSSTSDVPSESFNRKNKKEKNTRAKSLYCIKYDLRKKQLDCKERRISAITINELKEAIKEHNTYKKKEMKYCGNWFNQIESINKYKYKLYKYYF